MKKIFTLILAFMMVLSLAACGGGSGNAPTGNPVEPSSSSEPECGHVWAEANYQAPKTCTVCGDTEGNPLASAFQENGYATNMAVGTAYDYKTICYTDPSKDATGTVTITDYNIVKSDETHEAKEGYEWRIVKVHCEADGENENAYGVQWRETFTDYYSGDLIYTAGEGEEATFTVNYNNEDYECTVDYKEIHGEWVAGGVGGYTFIYSYEYSVLVPTGYDGCVLVLYNAALGSAELNDLASVTDSLADIVDEDTLFFRLAS